MRLVVGLALLCASALQAQPAAPVSLQPAWAERPPTHDAAQLVVVTTASWTSTTGRLQRWERGAQGWQAAGPAVDVVVGQSGLGWGIGLQGFAQGPGEPKKMEGDSRAPAGIFPLTSTLGKGGVPQTRMPRHTIDADDVCVDDVSSAFYNRVVVDAPPVSLDSEASAPWNSAEPMLRPKDALYDLAVVVDHNHAVDAADGMKPIKGAGSCVFLHVWRRPNSPTIGCTAMPHAALIDVVMWLDPAKQPLLVQLPRDIYSRVREPWALP